MRVASAGVLGLAGCLQDETDEQGLDTETVEELVVTKSNRRRTVNDVPEVQTNDMLAEAAQSHSRDMKEREYFAHENPDGTTARERIMATGISCGATGENLHQTWYDEQISNERGTYTLTDAEEVAEDIVVGFMRSPPHRETLLDSRFDRTGVGVALNKDGKVYATQNFCGQSS